MLRGGCYCSRSDVPLPRVLPPAVVIFGCCAAPLSQRMTESENLTSLPSGAVYVVEPLSSS